LKTKKFGNLPSSPGVLGAHQEESAKMSGGTTFGEKIVSFW